MPRIAPEMHLYDTATRRTAEFSPRGDHVGVYVCGITPYDAGHLGHAFTYHTFDILSRRLRGMGVTVRSVRNITDVDDDVLRVSRERGVDFRSLGDSVVAGFDNDMALIGIAPVDAAPRATQHVESMIHLITRLHATHAAYVVEGWVYFDVSAFGGYGELSRLSQDAMVALSRERGADPDDPRKRHPLDFVLWQPSLPDEPRWTSPWGEGRPGWHIECSAMAADELELPIDIHGGGDDLIFPHHESEIAQSEAAGDRPFCRHWMHVAMVGYRGEKMSKSLGNLVLVRDVASRVAPQVVRILLCARHYRSGWEYSDELLAEAQARYAVYTDAVSRGRILDASQADDYRTAFAERIDDDLDTPGALAVLDRVAAASRRTRPGASSGGGVSGASLITELLGQLGAA